MSITGRARRRFRDEALLAAPESLDLERDQHHAVARSRVRIADHLHDHDAVAREQHEFGHPIQRRAKSADQLVASPNDFDRPERDDQAQQSSYRSRGVECAAGGIETSESRHRRGHPARPRIAGAETGHGDGRIAAGAAVSQ